MSEHNRISFMCPTFIEESREPWSEEDWCAAELGQEERFQIQANWVQELPSLMERLTDRWHEVARLETLQKEISLLKDRCAALERLAPLLVPIQTFAPEPYELIKPLHAVVCYQDEQYIATLFDANLGASGDTQTEAVLNLKEIIAGTFEMLTGVDEDKLGPGPLQQRKVLEALIRKQG